VTCRLSRLSIDWRSVAINGRKPSLERKQQAAQHEAAGGGGGSGSDASSSLILMPRTEHGVPAFNSGSQPYYHIEGTFNQESWLIFPAGCRG
jgi:hypothetical protein